MTKIGPFSLKIWCPFNYKLLLLTGSNKYSEVIRIRIFMKFLFRDFRWIYLRYALFFGSELTREIIRDGPLRPKWVRPCQGVRPNCTAALRVRYVFFMRVPILSRMVGIYHFVEVGLRSHSWKTSKYFRWRGGLKFRCRKILEGRR